MTGHLRGDARKRQTDAHQIHPEPAVRALIERERRAAAVAALLEAAGDMPFGYSHAAFILTDRADRIERGDA